MPRTGKIYVAIYTKKDKIKVKKMKIIINVMDDISPSIALSCVQNVIRLGKASDYNSVKAHYWWVTDFSSSEGDIRVSIIPYRKSDSFRVYKINEK